MERRGVAACVIFTIISCGIYGLYWKYKIAQGFYVTQTQEKVETSPGITLLLFIVTGGIYGWYCYYKWGRATTEIATRFGRADGDKAIIYLLLSIFGFPIICDALIQSDFNNWLDAMDANAHQNYGGPPPYQGGPPPYQGSPPPYQGSPPPYQGGPPPYQGGPPPNQGGSQY